MYVGICVLVYLQGLQRNFCQKSETIQDIIIHSEILFLSETALNSSTLLKNL